MSRFKSYTENLLLEKVSRKEIKEALKNTNILVGCEFEIISYDLENLNNTNTEYEAAYNDWLRYKNELIQFGEKWNELNDEIWKIENKILKHNESIDDLELELDNVEEDDTIPDELKKRKIKNIKDNIEIEKRQIRHLKEKSEELEIDIDDIELPAPPSTYIEYMVEYMDYDPMEKFDSVIWAQENWHDERDFLEEPMDIGNPVDAIERLDFINAPFYPDYEIGVYEEVEQRVGSKTWAIEPDNSLGDYGIEIKSPPLPLPEALEVIQEMFEWIEGGFGFTDNRTGFHVHMSMKGVNNLNDVIDPIKLILFTDEDYIWNVFPDRKYSEYVRSVKDKLKTDGDVEKVKWDKLADVNKAKAYIFSNHFDVINFANMDEGHVEFRYMGGSNYSRKYKTIESMIGVFAHNFSLAMDEKYKRKEYFHKLQRIFNKIEPIKLRWEKYLIDQVLVDYKSELNDKQKKILTKRYKEIINSIKSLPYKIDEKNVYNHSL